MIQNIKVLLILRLRYLGRVSGVIGKTFFIVHTHTLNRIAKRLPSIGVEPVVNGAKGVNNPGVVRFDVRGFQSGNVLRGDNQDPSRFNKICPQLVKWVGDFVSLGCKKKMHRGFFGSDASKRLQFRSNFNPKPVFFTN